MLYSAGDSASRSIHRLCGEEYLDCDTGICQVVGTGRDLSLQEVVRFCSSFRRKPESRADEDRGGPVFHLLTAPTGKGKKQRRRSLTSEDSQGHSRLEEGVMKEITIEEASPRSCSTRGKRI